MMLGVFGAYMNKEIEKYVGLYLLVYVIVLAVCGFFQYMAVCQGQSLACVFDMDGINKIITTTAYVLTPIVAIIGFLSWKGQYNKTTISGLSKEIYNLLDEENLLAFKYRGYISDYYKKSNNNSHLRNELMEKSNQIFDKIRLLQKITNNDKLEKLNQDNRTSSYGIILNFELQLAENVERKIIEDTYYMNYNNNVNTKKLIKNELDNYILV